VSLIIGIYIYIDKLHSYLQNSKRNEYTLSTLSKSFITKTFPVSKEQQFVTSEQNYILIMVKGLKNIYYFEFLCECVVLNILRHEMV